MNILPLFAIKKKIELLKEKIDRRVVEVADEIEGLASSAIDEMATVTAFNKELQNDFETAKQISEGFLLQYDKFHEDSGSLGISVDTEAFIKAIFKMSKMISDNYYSANLSHWRSFVNISEAVILDKFVKMQELSRLIQVEVRYLETQYVIGEKLLQKYLSSSADEEKAGNHQRLHDFIISIEEDYFPTFLTHEVSF